MPITITESAYHESGHFVTDFLLGINVERVSVAEPEGQYSQSEGRCILESDWRNTDKKRKIIGLLAGQFAQQLSQGEETSLPKDLWGSSGAVDDNDCARKLCEELVEEIDGTPDWKGRDLRHVSISEGDRIIKGQAAIQKRVDELFQMFLHETKKIIDAHRGIVVKVAKCLLKQDTKEKIDVAYGHKRILKVKELAKFELTAMMTAGDYEFGMLKAGAENLVCS